jgi:hypothetical protein
MKGKWMGMIDQWSRASAERVRVQADLAVRAKQTCDRARAAIDGARRVRAEVAATRCEVTVHRRCPQGRAVPSYWIAHPTATAFISALSQDGVGQLLTIAADWLVGRYVIREHWPAECQPGQDDRPWGHALKDGDGRVRVESKGEPLRG